MASGKSVFTPQYFAEDRSGITLGVSIAFTVLETLFVLLFFIARYVGKTRHGMDSYLILPAYLMCMAIIIVNYLLISHAGVGRHFFAVSKDELTYYLKLSVVMQFIYVPAISLPRLSILALYLRVFTTKFYRYSTYGIAAFIVTIFIISTVLAVTECTPFAYNWDRLIPGGHCIDLLLIFRWVSILNLTSDVATLLLPLPVIWRLQTSLNQKIGLTITFLTGSIGIVTAILRFYCFVSTNIFSDITWYTVEMSSWTTAESGFYLIAACLPSLRPLIPIVRDHIKYSGLSRFLGTYTSKMFSPSSSKMKASRPSSKDSEESGAASLGAGGSEKPSPIEFQRLDDCQLGTRFGEGDWDIDGHGHWDGSNKV